VTLSASITGGREPYQVVWTDSAGVVVGGERQVTVDRPGAYWVSVIGANGCAASDVVTVTQDVVAPEVAVSADGALTCATPEVTLTAAIEGGRPPYTIEWIGPSGSWCGSTASIVVTEPGTYAVIAAGRNGCLASASVTVARDVASPLVDLGPDLILTCSDPEAVLCALPRGGTGPFSYVWSRDCGSIPGGDPELRVACAGTYTVAVTGANGCSTYDSVTVRDGINPPTVDLGADRELDCCGAGIELVPEITGGVEPYAYAWYNECDAIIGSEPTLTVTQPGVFLLIIRTADGCIASDTIIVQEPSP